MARKETKTDRVMSVLTAGPSGQEASGAAMSGQEASGAGDNQTQGRDIETITADILAAKTDGGNAILRMGRGLLEAKEKLSHGEWLEWLAERVEFSERAAQRLMQVARNYSNPTLVADLGIRKAVNLLALPEGEREDFIAAPHVVDGVEKSVTDMSARELEQAIRERDEARRERDEAAKEKSEAEKKAAGLKESYAAAHKNEQYAIERAKKLQEELDALKSKPVEASAVVVDEEAVREAVNQAVKEAEKRAEEKKKAALAASDKALNQANQARDKAVKQAEDAEKARAEAVREKEAAVARADRLEKAAGEAKITTEDRVTANYLVKQIGTELRDLMTLYFKARDSGDEELANAVRGKLESWKKGMEETLK